MIAGARPALAAWLTVLGMLGAGDAGADEVAFGKCRRVADAVERLACYDAIPHPVAPPVRPSSAAHTAEQRASASAPAAAPARVSPPGADTFGLPSRARTQELQSIRSTVGADFFGWGPTERIRLENGQVWEVLDGSSGTVGPVNRQVTVRRGALGSFFLEFEGLNISPRVRRLR